LFGGGCLPDDQAHDTIFAHWDDLRTDHPGGGIFTSLSGTAPNRVLSVEWRAVYAEDPGKHVNFEVRLYEGQPRFDLIYGTVDEGGSYSVEGVQQGTGSAATQFACKSAGSLSPGLGLSFTLNGGVPVATATPTQTDTPVPTPTGSLGVTFHDGDILADTVNGPISHLDSTGALLATLDAGKGQTNIGTGLCFDAADNLYVPYPGTEKLGKFDATGKLVSQSWAVEPEHLKGGIENCTATSAGHVFALFAQRQVDEFDGSGALLARFLLPEPATWIDLAADQCTLYYTSGGSIGRFDVCRNVSLPDLITGLYQCSQFQLRANGEILAACTTSPDQGLLASIYRLDSAGRLIQLYTSVFSAAVVALDPDGTSFWTTGEPLPNSYSLVKVDIATDTVLSHLDQSTLIISLAIVGALDAAHLPLTPLPTSSAIGTAPTAAATASATATPSPIPQHYAVSTATGATLVPGTTDTGNHCVDCQTQITLPFSYSLYGEFNANTVWVTSNGLLTFDVNNPDGAYNNTCLPNAYVGSTIFAHWDDLRTDQPGGGIFTSISGSAPDRIFNIEWRAVYTDDLSKHANFEIRLYEGQPRFDLVYGSVDEGGGSATIGVQQDSGVRSFDQYACNTAGSLTPGLVLTYTLSSSASTSQHTPIPFALGDVFVGRAGPPPGMKLIENEIGHYTSNGTRTDILDLASNDLGIAVTGACFDGSGNLYATAFTNHALSKFNKEGILLKSTWGQRQGSDPIDLLPESCVVDAAGNVYVGEATITGLPSEVAKIFKFNAAGDLLATYAPQTEDKGIDWIDLADDQCTMYYTSEGGSVKRFNVCTNRQLPDFAEHLAAPCFALRIRSNGEVLVACTRVYRLDRTGKVIQTYTNSYQLPYFALNLDPDGHSFWSADSFGQDVYHYDIETGAVLTHFYGTLTSVNDLDQMAGLAVYGELRAAQSPSGSTPTPTATDTPLPTNTQVPPTASPTDTATDTPVPPTATATSSPTGTSTQTPVPPTDTFTRTATNTPVPPTSTFTNTPIPPSNTPTQTSVPPTSSATRTATSTPTPTSTTPTSTFTRTPTTTPVAPTATRTATPVRSDTTPPSCALTGTGINSAGQKYIQISVQDSGSGLKTVLVTQSTNAATTVPFFTPGTTGALLVTATKINQSLSAQVGLEVADVAGNVTDCDPAMTDLIKDSRKPVTDIFTGILPSEHLVHIYNGNPGLSHLLLKVNGRKMNERDLQPNEQRTVDIAAALYTHQVNTVTIVVRGRQRGEATLVIADS
jgi:sugar lactone lactonase YvrE